MKRLACALGSSSNIGMGGGGGLIFHGSQCLLSRGQRHRGLQHRRASSSSSPVSAEITKLKQRLVQAGMSEDAFKEPTRPRPLITDVVFEGLYDREASLTKLCDALSKRLQVKKANPYTTDRNKNPIVAIAAGPGAGKTRFIDTCMTLGKVGSPVDLASVCPDKDLHKELERCIPISVTYNSFCTPSAHESNFSLEHSLICRMLYSYFCWANVPFGAFLDRLCLVAPEFRFLVSLDQVVEKISNDGQHPVFLAVDELMKATTITGNVMPLLTYIGSVLDNRPNFHAMVTSLDPDVVGNITASSGRPVHWVPLSPLSYKHSIEAVAKHGLQFRVNKGTVERPEFVERSLESEECRAARAVIADCNGHPRSLETALGILQTYSVIGDNKSPVLLPPYSQLIDQLTDAVKPIYHTAIKACPSIDELVSPALSSVSVDFYGSPHNRPGAPTYSSYIASGLYLNSKNQTYGIPLLSPLTLRVILKIKSDWKLAEPIRALLSMDDVRWPDGFAYERFHAHWECLWRELHRMRGKNEISLLEFYSLAGTKSVFQDVHFQVAPKMVAQLGSDVTDEASQGGLEAAICLPKKPNQAGFDLATLETVTAVASKGNKAAASRDVQMKLLLCHECKYSLRDSPKSYLPQMLEAKYKNWKEQMEKWATVNDEAKLVHKRLIAVVFRTPSEHAPVTDKEDMLVVVRRQLEKLYGPTLATRPQFLLDYHPANQQQQGPTASPANGNDAADTDTSLPHNG